MLTIKEKIKAACEHSGISLTELGRQMGMSQSAISNKLARGNLNQTDLQRIAQILDCRLEISFNYPDGTKIE